MLPLPPPRLGGAEPDPEAHRQMFGLEGPLYKGRAVSQPGPGDGDEDTELHQQDSDSWCLTLSGREKGKKSGGMFRTAWGQGGVRAEGTGGESQIVTDRLWRRSRSRMASP